MAPPRRRAGPRKVGREVQRSASKGTAQAETEGSDIAPFPCPPPRRPSGSSTSPTSTKASSACGAETRPPWCAWCPTPPSSSARTRSTSAYWAATTASAESEPSLPPPPKKKPSQRDYITLFSCLPPAQRFRTSLVYPVSPQNLSPRTATDPTCAPERVGKVLVVHSFVRGGGKARQPGQLQDGIHPETLPRAARFTSAGFLAASAVPPSLPAPRPVGTRGVGL